MRPVPATGRLLSLLVCLSQALIRTNTFAGEANPPPPQSSVRQTSNGLPVLAFPYPAAQQYTVFGATNAAGPYVTPTPGLLTGPTFLVTNPALRCFYRVSATQMSSNDLFSATVLNRLTYGPTPGDLDHIKAVGPEQFIAEQLAAEAIAETIDTDPPITNAPPPPPPLTNWIRGSATGTAAATNLIVYLSGAGKVYLDDLRLVAGTNADTGANLIANGDFEDATLSPPWIVGSPFTAVITNSPTVDGLAASGAKCLLLTGTAGSTGVPNALWQPFATSTPAASQKFTLSFSYLPVPNSGSNVLTVRLSGSLTIAKVPLPQAPPLPPAAPPAIAAVYARLTNVTASLDELRAWHVFHAIHGQRQLHEILAQFFQNHFTTEYQKTKDWFDENYSRAITNATVRQWLAVDLHWREYRKFRDLLLNPNTTFYDLLKVSIESPAMIIYLDTVLNTRAAPNQNYARELMELHTLGVDNGYIQQDIVDMSKVWTGWRVAKKDPSVANDPFAPPVTDITNSPGVWVLRFTTNNHDLTTKRLFTNNVIDPRFGPEFRGGLSYALLLPSTNATGTNGFGEAYRVIQHLSTLPYTMEFISVKLCRLFVHEDFDFGLYDYTASTLTPEAQLIKDCMTAWNTPAADGRQGNIRSVLNVIFRSALFRGHAASQQKIKTPLELAVSAVRALRVVDTDAKGYVTATADSDGYGISGSGANTSPLNRMGGMLLFNKVEPDGYSEFGGIWLNTANLCERMRFVQHLLMPTSSSLKSADYGAPGTRNTSDPVKLLKLKLPAGSWNDPAAVADYFLGLLYPGEGMANLGLDRAAAIEFLNTNEAGASSPFSALSNTSTAYDGRVRGMVALLMCLPRFQEQ